jgi:response regulator RpfG family c-di-GMP phosphodiesterase
MNYKAKITVLHVEDERKIAKSLNEELIKRNIFAYNADNLQDAINVIKRYDVDFIISDGTFPVKKGSARAKSFIPLINKIKKLKKKIEVIAWANSTHVHEYCKKNKLESYSKKVLTKKDFARRKREFIKVQKLNASQLAAIIEKKFLEKINFYELVKDYNLESYYSEPATVLAVFMAADMRTGHLDKTAGLNYGLLVSEIKDGVITQYIDKKDDKKVSDAIYNKLINKKYFSVMDKNIQIRSKKLLGFSRSLRKINY